MMVKGWGGGQIGPIVEWDNKTGKGRVKWFNFQIIVLFLLQDYDQS